MRVVIFGGRNFTHRRLLDAVLDRLHARLHFTVVIEGDYKGVDRMAGDWARKRGLGDEKFPADWKLHRKRAGPIRNQAMIDQGKPDVAIGFPGGDGTRDMTVRARMAGIDLYTVEITKDWGRIMNGQKRVDEVDGTGGEE